MTRSIALLCCAIAFLTAIAAVRQRAALIGKGYELTRLEKERERLVLSAADLRERVSRRSSPAALARLGNSLGLSATYTRDFTVVRVGIPVFSPPAVAAAGRRGGPR